MLKSTTDHEKCKYHCALSLSLPFIPPHVAYPSIHLQFMRCSVEGLSLYMFILAVLGNVTYGLGILLYSVDSIFLLQKLPWLVGSIGTLSFDITVSLPLILLPFT
jgi:hypothetical protein